MSQKPETAFRGKLVPKLKALPNSWWESIQQKTIQGTPDIIGCLSGVFIGLELKATAKSPITELQLLKQDRIKAAGGYAAVVYPENAELILTHLTMIAHKGHTCLRSL